jgi:hypothetical protein
MNFDSLTPVLAQVVTVTSHDAMAQSGLATRGYAVGWVTLALINAGLAQPKGRSGLLWFLASLLLGPVATFLIVVMGPVGSPTIPIPTQAPTGKPHPLDF